MSLRSVGKTPWMCWRIKLEIVLPNNANGSGRKLQRKLKVANRRMLMKISSSIANKRSHKFWYWLLWGNAELGSAHLLNFGNTKLLYCVNNRSRHHKEMCLILLIEWLNLNCKNGRSTVDAVQSLLYSDTNFFPQGSAFSICFVSIYNSS